MTKLTKICLSTALVVASLNTAFARTVTKVEVIGAVSGEIKVKSSNKAGGVSRVQGSIDRISEDIKDRLQRGDNLEMWLVDRGAAEGDNSTSVDAGDSDFSTFQSFDGAVTSVFAVQNNNATGVNLDNIPLINLVEAAPYALSVGALKVNKKGDYVVNYKTRNSLSPYDFLMVTLESGGNLGDYDPRPGSEVGRGSLF